jgi:hypothetical protein
VGRYSRRLLTLNRQRAIQRDRRIVAAGRRVDALTRSIERRLLGVVAAGRGGLHGVRGSVDVILLGVPVQMAALIEELLGEMWHWGWQSATTNWIKAIPLSYWIGRLRPAVPIAGTEGVSEELQDESDIERILNGEVSRSEAEQIVREMEFPPPSPAKVDAILRGTNAPDGIDAISRIKTVIGPDLQRLRSTIISGYSGVVGSDGASALEGLATSIRPLLSENEGINWKAKRIARTESVRIAEHSLRDSWRAVADVIEAIRTFTADDENVRDAHRRWEDKLFYQTSTGNYIARDGEYLPEFPAGPNCRCWSTPELREEEIAATQVSAASISSAGGSHERAAAHGVFRQPRLEPVS